MGWCKVLLLWWKTCKILDVQMLLYYERDKLGSKCSYGICKGNQQRIKEETL